MGSQSYKTIPIEVASTNSALVGQPKLKLNKNTLTIDLQRSHLLDADGITNQKSYWEITRTSGSKITVENVDELNLSPVDFELSTPLADVFIFGADKPLRGAQLTINSYVEALEAVTKTNALGQFSLSTAPQGPVRISLSPDEIEIFSSVEVEENQGNKEIKSSNKLVLNATEEMINLTDVLSSLKHIVGLRIVSGASFTKGDVNSDGAIDLSDVLGMLKHIVRLRELPSAQVVSEDYFISKHLGFAASLNEANQVEIDLSANLEALSDHYGSELLGYSVEFSSHRDADFEISFDTSIDAGILLASNTSTPALSITAKLDQTSSLSNIDTFEFATAILGQDGFGIADLQVDVELILQGSEQIVKEHISYYFEEGSHLNGAVDLTTDMQNLVIYAPGDLDGTFNDYQGYILI